MDIDLNYLVDNGIIDLPNIQSVKEKKKRQELLNNHPYKIWCGSNGKWYTYLPDETKGRVLKKKSTKKEQTLQFESDDEDFYYGTTQQAITAGSEVVKYDNSNLMNYIKELKDELKTYYKSQIQDKLFEYELLK